MPSLDAGIQTKIDALRLETSEWSVMPEVYEIVKISWESPTGTKYYGKVPVHLVSSVALPFEDEVIQALEGDAQFLSITSDSTLADSEINIEIFDGGYYDPETATQIGAGDFADLVYEQGEGVPCEIYLWFPSQELLLSTWQGHLRTAEGADNEIWRGTIANGFRSPNVDLPRRAHYSSCQAVFGGKFTTQAEVDENGCPYNRNVSGGVVGTNGFTECDRRNLASCTTRGINTLNHLSHQSAVVTVVNNQTKGPQLLSISRGNESNLKEPVRVVMGTRKIKDCNVLAFRRDYNNNTPAHGWFSAIYELCEGPISAVYGAYVKDKAADPQHTWYRLGTQGQTAIDTALSTHGYSNTALLRNHYGWINPATVGPDSMRAEAFIIGLNDIRQYTDEETYTTGYLTNRVWQIARMWCDKRWGLGNDYERLNIQSWIDAGTWTAATVRFTDPFGINYDHTRSNSNVELVGRSAIQQIEDMCLAGRLSRPYLFQNKIHIDPYKPLTEGELADVKLFTDKGTPRNIVVDESGKSTLTRSQKSDVDLPNRIECTISDATQDFQEIPIDPVEDVDQQLRAGRIQGDTSRRTITKKYSLLGVTDKNEATKIAYSLLWFGEFGDGGTKNNLQISFRTFVLETLELHENAIIQLDSDQLTRYGFDYFKIDRMTRDSDLHVTIEATAFNQTELEDFEGTVSYTQPTYDPVEQPIPADIGYGSINYGGGIMKIYLEEVAYA